jgi:hypothetical protein
MQKEEAMASLSIPFRDLPGRIQEAMKYYRYVVYWGVQPKIRTAPIPNYRSEALALQPHHLLMCSCSKLHYTYEQNLRIRYSDYLNNTKVNADGFATSA